MRIARYNETWPFLLRLAASLVLLPCFASASLAQGNQAPVCTGISADMLDVCVGENVQLTAYATDPSGKSLTYKWTCTGGKIVADGSKATLYTDGLKPGKYTVKAEVSDGYNPSVDCTVTINVADP